MSKFVRLAAVSCAAVLIAAGAPARAQTCIDSVGEGSGPSREIAMRQAYEAVLRGVSPQLLGAWNASGQRIGDAPGHSVRKLTNKCSASGGAQRCRIEATICKN